MCTGYLAQVSKGAHADDNKKCDATLLKLTRVKHHLQRPEGGNDTAERAAGAPTES